MINLSFNEVLTSAKLNPKLQKLIHFVHENPNKKVKEKIKLCNKIILTYEKNLTKLINQNIFNKKMIKVKVIPKSDFIQFYQKPLTALHNANLNIQVYFNKKLYVSVINAEDAKKIILKLDDYDFLDNLIIYYINKNLLKQIIS